jgi:NADPH:quinone reductase-like Zn-dependent oxidoreductase
MKAAFFREHGGLDRVEFGDLPEPAAGAGQVRVRVRAAALNHMEAVDRGRGQGGAAPHLRRLEEKRQFGKIVLRVD